MQKLVTSGAQLPACKPTSAFHLLKLSQATASLPMASGAASQRQFSNYNDKQRTRFTRLSRRNSRSPGRSSSPGAHNVPHRHSYQSQLPRIVPQEEVEQTQPNSVFSHDSTLTLCKKLLIYKMMGSNVFINYSLMGISAAYKVLGTKLTNYAIENTAASVFTGGVSVADLSGAADELEQRGIGTIGCYVVEGIRDAQNEKLDQFLDFSVDSIRSITEGGKQGHFALKLTAYISTDLMEKVSEAQERFTNEVLNLRYDAEDDSVLTRDQLAQNLEKIGVSQYERQDFDKLVSRLSKGSHSPAEMTNICRYANGHVFDLYAQEHTALERQIAQKLGGVTEKDYENLARFSERVSVLSDEAFSRNCRLYVDAEQTFIQASIESFGQQMTHKLNIGDNVTIMNGYQCYLKRMESLIPMEVRASKSFDYNLGIKLIRGAYMMEERGLAVEQGKESPVWDEIDQTHHCYNQSMSHIISHMKSDDALFVASHNTETCDLAMNLTNKHNLKHTNSVQFGQLKGFSDQVTSDIANKGFEVFKYLPFGPTEQVMPYLVRRGQESRQVLREQQFQNTFLKKEILSRFGL